MRAAVALSLVIASTFVAPAMADDITGHPRIHDADTIFFGTQEVRLDGIDAPEPRQTCQDATGKSYPCGQSAIAALVGEIGNASIRCSGTQHDSHHRLLVTCFKDSENLNGWLVAHGWAVAFRSLSTGYVSQEDQARAAKLGMWAGTFDQPREWRKTH